MKVYTHSKYSYVKVAEIPKDEIRKIDFALCKQPTETLSSFYNRQTDKPAIVANAGFFNMTTGGTVFNYVNEGQTISYNQSYQWGMGIIGDNTMQYGWLKAKSWRDFIGGYPVLLDNKRKCDYSYASEINYKARRTAIGYNDDTIFIVCVETPGMAFPALQDLMLDVGCKYAINLDGGGSTKMLHNGKSVTKDDTNRAIDNVVAIYLKAEAQKQTKDIDVTYQAYTKGKWWGSIKNYNTTNSNGYAGVETNAIQGIKMKLSEGSVQYRVHTTDGKWLPWVTDDSDYAGIIGEKSTPINCCFKGKFKVTSTRDNRINPVNNKSEYHGGLDLVALGDKSIYAIADGVIEATPYEANGFGYYVRQTLPDGSRLYYAHMAKGSICVKAGQRVKKGDKLGTMGNTGSSTGAHTHLEWRVKGTSKTSLNICDLTNIPNAVGTYKSGSAPTVSKDIDAIQVRLIGDIADTHEIKYRVSTVNSTSYLPWVKGDSDYAGVFGRGIDKVQMVVEKK